MFAAIILLFFNCIRRENAEREKEPSYNNVNVPLGRLSDIYLNKREEE